jgi:hypothetical protein
VAAQGNALVGHNVALQLDDAGLGTPGLRCAHVVPDLAINSALSRYSSTKASDAAQHAV